MTVRRFFAAFVMCAAILGVIISTPGRAQTAAAADPALQAQYDQLFQQMLKDPGNLDLMFAFAAVANKLGNYESAISTLERMLLFNPNLPRVKLELGVLYFKLESYAIARAYFEDAVKSGTAPAIVVERVQIYLDEIDRRESRHFVSGAVDFGFRYQNNANAGPASNNIRVLGIDATLDDEFLGKEDGNFFVGGQATHRYDLRSDWIDTWDTNGSLLYTHQFTFDELNILFTELKTGPRIPISTAQNFGSYIRPYLLVNFLHLGSDPYFYTYGGGVHGRQALGDKAAVTAGYERRHKEFVNSSSRPTNSLSTSDDNVGRLEGQYFLSQNVLAGLNLSLVDANARAVFESYVEYLIGAYLSVQFPAPFALTEFPWRVDISALGALTDYDGPDPSVDPNVTREDREWRVNVTTTANVTRDWSAYVQFGYADNMSNLPNFAFTNFTTVVGARRQFSLP